MAASAQLARQARAAQRVRAAGSWNRGLRLEPLAKLAHELRTPIQVLLGYLDILRGELADTVGRRPQEIIERMNINAHDLAQTIENLMDFASASMDAEWRRNELIVLRELVDEVRPYFDAASHGKALQLKIDLSAAPHRIRSWRRALKSILLNLGLNAIKFTEAGSVVMAIRGLPSRSGLTLLEIRANDSGVGFDRAKFLAVRPWVQISNSSTRLYRGMGLGLSVVLNNVEKLGGSVCVSTAPDRGSRFRVRIPLAPVPPASDNAA